MDRIHVVQDHNHRASFAMPSLYDGDKIRHGVCVDRGKGSSTTQAERPAEAARHPLQLPARALQWCVIRTPSAQQRQ